MYLFNPFTLQDFTSELATQQSSQTIIRIAKYAYFLFCHLKELFRADLGSASTLQGLVFFTPKQDCLSLNVKGKVIHICKAGSQD